MMSELNAFVPGTTVRVEGRAGGPLSGISFVAKDLIDVAGLPTGGGNPDWQRTHATPGSNAWSVEQLLGAGADLIGKTITCEISLGILGFNQFLGTPTNPKAPGCLPGGSSSGSASAVAAGVADTGLGTDSGGSVRVPASFCGLYGMRPSFGRIPVDGVVTQAPSFDTVGWFTRDAELFARVGEVLLQTAIPASHGAPELLIADDYFEVSDPGVAEALGPAVEALSSVIGAARHLSLSQGQLEHWDRRRTVCQRSEMWRTFGPWVDQVNPRFAFNVARTLTSASLITPEQIAIADVVRSVVRARATSVLSEGAILCFPTTPFAAPELGLPLQTLTELGLRIGRQTSFAGLTGVPQLNLPVGTLSGKPIGLSIIARHGHDERLIALARALEARLG